MMCCTLHTIALTVSLLFRATSWKCEGQTGLEAVKWQIVVAVQSWELLFSSPYWIFLPHKKVKTHFFHVKESPHFSRPQFKRTSDFYKTLLNNPIIVTKLGSIDFTFYGPCTLCIPHHITVVYLNQCFT